MSDTLSETLNSFVEFISEDPLMLGLCVIIIILFILFIIVLVAGGKKNKASAPVETVSNNEELIKDNLDDEPLKSTQEFNATTIQEASSDVPKNIEVQSDSGDMLGNLTEQEAPITIDEAISLKNASEPIIPNLNEKVAPVKVELTEEPVRIEVPTDVEVKPEAAPIMPEPPIKEAEKQSQPFSSVYLNNSQEIPKPVSDMSNTEIIRHMPVMEGTNPSDIVKPATQTTVKEEESLDDIDLPKLNDQKDDSVLNTLTGETFDIK